ncbi:MAG TPA: aldehyde ferredoxin oxidoreductase family protein [Firmicutes bacterium]|nr:aldehyde ferredoxin oxidoreductase family protein [Bacillota bacterium]
MFGYAGRLLRVNLSDRKIEIESLDEGTARKYIGGSGLAGYFLVNETGVETDPLGPENLLIMMAGPLTGTRVPTSGRHAIVAKSPLTGIWGESDVGGTWGATLKRAGFDGIIVSGISDTPVYLLIDEDGTQILDARELWGKDTYETDKAIKHLHGEKAVTACIGQAGERLVKFAAVMTDGKDARAAGRCGMGAVMGSKKLKAIAVRGNSRVKCADEEALTRSLKEVVPKMVQNAKGLSTYGTAGGLPTMEFLGDFPIKNWSLGKWEEQAKRISGQAVAERMLTGRYHCAACPIGCGREVRIDSGKYAPVEGAGPEYETLAMLGANVLVDDLEAICKANEMCNRYGLDTISTGGVIGYAFEAFERGFLTIEDTDGLRLEWGSADVLLSLIDKIARREGLGDRMAEGTRAFARSLGPRAIEFAVETKGLDFPAHDPRAYNSVGLAYATSARGACHLSGFTHNFEKTLNMPELGYPEVQDRFGVEGKGRFTALLQDLMCMMDSLKLCKFSLSAGIKLTQCVEWLNIVTGWDVSAEEFMRTGERLFNMKRMYNVKHGTSRKDDTLPYRILTSRRKEGGAATNLPPLGELLSQYYEHRGWDEFGVPKPEKLKELGLA